MNVNRVCFYIQSNFELQGHDSFGLHSRRISQLVGSCRLMDSPCFMTEVPWVRFPLRLLFFVNNHTIGQFAKFVIEFQEIMKLNRDVYDVLV